MSLGQKTGPVGVTLSLRKKGSSEVLASTTSGPEGVYLFAEVLPGDYEVTGSHASWLLEPATTEVTVDKETGHAGPLTVKGYDVTGTLFQVQFVIY